MKLRVQDLYTFHVVARSGAMHEAARELGVTPGAISQRIRAVEERHGRRLFARSRNGIALTAAGEALFQDIGAAFRQIEAAHSKHFAKRAPTNIRISAAPGFAHSTLVTSLGAFSERHPSIRISLETEERLADLRSEPLDLAIRHGLGNYQGLESVWLCSPELVVVASPDLLARYGPIQSPADCLKFPLLPDSTENDWALWFQAQGIDAARARYGTAFKDDFLTVKATLEGQGLALLKDVYLRDDLSAGRLVRALAGSWPTAFAYYAVALPETFQRPAVRRLVDWLVSTSAVPEDQAAPNPAPAQ